MSSVVRIVHNIWRSSKVPVYTLYFIIYRRRHRCRCVDDARRKVTQLRLRLRCLYSNIHFFLSILCSPSFFLSIYPHRVAFFLIDDFVVENYLLTFMLVAWCSMGEWENARVEGPVALPHV